VCTLALYFQQSARHPLVVAANRDEYLERPATAPMRVSDDPWIVAGMDLVAGGTWLGVNQHTLVVGLLNRRTAVPPDPSRRSRGLLCLETLSHTDVASARAAVSRATADDYNSFNLLVASPAAGFVAQNLAGTVVVTDLRPGMHLLTNLDLNDPTCPRIARSSKMFDDAAALLDDADVGPLTDRLRTILSDHATPLDPRETNTPNSLCMHLGPYGTRSSSLLIYSAEAKRTRFFHADGPPCTTAYHEVLLP
jgi:uncharacterized protein with NRDE domain